ncbi:MAG: CBS domain-containing protein [Marivibrio sp.]|uniref:CBS domain-containing protein n=1 Tax=Marivibrio sp. TaxID=2039719 RepID=UPI0032EC3A80
MSNRPLEDMLRGRTAVSVAPDASVTDAVRVMTANDVGAVLVMQDGALKGIFTERDLLRRVVAQGRDPAATAVSDAMTTEVVALDAKHKGYEAFQLMHFSDVGHVVVTGLPDAAGFGVVSIRDFPPGDLCRFETELEFEDHLWQVV